MALTLENRTADVLTTAQFIEYVERCIDVADPDSLASCAPAFKALLNNRTLVSDVIAQELRSWRDFQKGNAYVATTLILGRSQRFFLRANIWLPPTKPDAARRDGAIYGLTHDHNFTFMTGGYFGSGYTTEIYEVDPHAVSGIGGERVRLDFLERTNLPVGKVMLYRAMHDVHRQSRPQELSISLNLVVPELAKTRPQLFFDLDRSEITHSEYPEHGRTLALFRLAAHAGNARTSQLLADIAAESPDTRLRAAAYETLCASDPGLACELQPVLGSDGTTHVRSTDERAHQRS